MTELCCECKPNLRCKQRDIQGMPLREWLALSLKLISLRIAQFSHSLEAVGG